MSHKKKVHQTELKNEKKAKTSRAPEAAEGRIKQSDIISGGSAGGHSYIVYRSGSSVIVSTDYTAVGGGYNSTPSYERVLYGSVEEFRKMKKEDVEFQAYNAWMDGAH
ncbi:MAG: hypothetical protein Q4A05_09920 [Ruminococcus sp.]|nr:hypothetical protein [Ruminococcus sp.]